MSKVSNYFFNPCVFLLYSLFYFNYGHSQSGNCNFLCNSDFEANQIAGSSYSQTNQVNVPCWSTTASNQLIEVWGDSFQGITAYSGNQFIEINASMVSTLFQNFTAVPGSSADISFAHHGRQGVDVLSVEIGPIGGPYDFLGNFTADQTAWVYNTISYSFPNNGVTNYTLRFNSVSTFVGNAGGNLLDAISIDLPHPEIDFSSVDPTCLNASGGSIDVNVSGGTPVYSYLWLTSPNSNSLNIQGLSEGQYVFEVTDAYGCVVKDSVVLDLQSSPITNTIYEYVCYNESYDFYGTVYNQTGSYNHTIPGPNGCDSLITLYLSIAPESEIDTIYIISDTTVEWNNNLYTKSGEYEFVTTNSLGCDSLIVMNLIINAPEDMEVLIEAPNVFSPNGDGLNDVWSFLILKNIEEVELIILNRWGNILYEAKNSAPTWNGINFKGNQAVGGVYFYIYKAFGKDSSVISGDGFFHLFR